MEHLAVKILYLLTRFYAKQCLESSDGCMTGIHSPTFTTVSFHLHQLLREVSGVFVVVAGCSIGFTLAANFAAATGKQINESGESKPKQ